MTPQILGLDLSTRRTGAAFPDGNTTAWVPEARHDEPGRLHWLTRLLTATIGRWPDLQLIVAEDVAIGTYPMAAQALSRMHGVLLLTAHTHNVPVARVNPTRLKRYATGRGNADKDAMVAAARAAGAHVAGHDEADAWLLRALGVLALGGPDLLDGPDPGHRVEVVADHTWPTVGRRR